MKYLCSLHSVHSLNLLVSDSTLCPAKLRSEVMTNSINTLSCSHYNTRPREPWIFSQLCEDFVLCGTDGSDKETRTLCTSFFQCVETEEGKWTSQMRNCVGGRMYSYDTDTCVSKPTGVWRCQSGVCKCPGTL
ncbi:hypothetical protein Hamer_G002310 [Homarus americanus]|uniref:Chitin-binding type-2 domain-containing protein n=1 Tax=Homarus americanus TaxID=6706 RepID=A0A8J5MU92_HOMAM|nr:hypothetical protein Hamer_G002310 [Homarus americanus]